MRKSAAVLSWVCINWKHKHGPSPPETVSICLHTLQIIIKRKSWKKGQRCTTQFFFPSSWDLMLQAYWHLHLQGFCGDSVTLFFCLCVDRWAAEWTSSANRDTYCRAPPIASVCQTSPGPGFSPPVSVSAAHQVFPPVFTWNFSSSSPSSILSLPIYIIYSHTQIPLNPQVFMFSRPVS